MNTASYSAGAVCCPDQRSANRHYYRGDRVTWWAPNGLYIDTDSPRFIIRRTGHREFR